jgi:hypothetical protein
MRFYIIIITFCKRRVRITTFFTILITNKNQQRNKYNNDSLSKIDIICYLMIISILNIIKKLFNKYGQISNYYHKL